PDPDARPVADSATSEIRQRRSRRVVAVRVQSFQPKLDDPRRNVHTAILATAVFSASVRKSESQQHESKSFEPAQSFYFPAGPESRRDDSGSSAAESSADSGRA